MAAVRVDCGRFCAGHGGVLPDMLTVPIKANDTELGVLRCVNIEGLDDGMCKYHCAYFDAGTGETHKFNVMHWRPSGAPALITAAMGMLAEAGVGRRDGDG